MSETDQDHVPADGPGDWVRDQFARYRDQRGRIVGHSERWARDPKTAQPFAHHHLVLRVHQRIGIGVDALAAGAQLAQDRLRLTRRR